MADFTPVPFISMSRSSLGDRQVPDVSLEILVEFVDELAPYWEFIGYALGLDVVVEQLRVEKPRSKDCCLQIFVEWTRRKGAEVSWEKLLYVLHTLKLNVCAENIEKYLKENTSTAQSHRHGVLSSNSQTKVEDCEDDVELRKQHEQELMEQIKMPRRRQPRGNEGEIRTQVAHDVIRSHYDTLIKCLPGRDLVPLMFSQKLISEYDKQVIDSEPTNYKKNDHILSALERRSGKQFEVFLKSLKRLRVSDHLVETLTGAYHQGIIKAGGTLPGKKNLTEDVEDHDSSLVISYQEALEKHGCVSVRVIRTLLVGPSGVGKSSLRHILVHGESKEIKTSTPAMETPDVLVAGENYAVEGKGSMWKLVTNECLTESVHACARQCQYKEGPHYPTSVGKLDTRVALEASSEADHMPKGMSIMQRKYHTESRDVDHKDPLEVAYSQLLKSGTVSEDRIQLQEMTFIHVIDSGGQPAFQDVLPLLLAIPCTYLLVFNASIPLTERITSTWRTEDGEQRLHDDPCSETHWQFMQRSLSTMQTMSDKFTVDESDTSIFQGAQSKFRFMLVGTFKDECVASQESDELLAAVNSRIATLKGRPYFDFFECPKQSQFFFVNNCMTLHDNLMEEDIANDREHLNELRQCIADENCALNLDVPVAWYYLQLITNSTEKKIWAESTLKEFCLKHHYIDEDQADKQFLCLLKLLHVLGFYAYFDLDPEYLKDGVNYVCTDATALYKEVSKLLAIQFYPNLPGVAKRFQGNGIIRHPYDNLFNKVDISSKIEPTWFLEVLHYLGIAARLSPASPHTCSYFIPSCLPYGGTNVQEICSVEPLCFTFVYKKDSFTTYCDLPRGLFCRLAVELADSKVQENVQMMVIANESKRTSIKYAVPFLSNSEIDSFMYLTEKPGHLCCQLIIPASTHLGSLSAGAVLQTLHDHCHTIREHLQTALECITESIFGRNYFKTASVEAVSSCPCQPDDCFIAPISPSGVAQCPYCRKSKKLSPQERVWFSRPNPTEAEVFPVEQNGQYFLKLGESLFKVEVSLEILVEFVDELAPHWEFIGYGLGLNVVVQQLKIQNTRPASLCMEMFVEWINRGHQVSWDKLLRVLDRQKLGSCAKKIMERLTNNTAFGTLSYQHGVLSSHLQAPKDISVRKSAESEEIISQKKKEMEVLQHPTASSDTLHKEEKSTEIQDEIVLAKMKIRLNDSEEDLKKTEMKEIFPGTPEELGKCAEVENVSNTEGKISFVDIMEFNELQLEQAAPVDQEDLKDLCWFPSGCQKAEVGSKGGLICLANLQSLNRTKQDMDNYQYVEVPANAIEDNEIACIHYGITPSGPFSFPDGYKLCSMVVYLVVRGAKLKKPMILHLPHWCCVEEAQKTSPEDTRVKCCLSPHRLQDNQKIFEFSFLKEDSYSSKGTATEIKIFGNSCLFADVCCEAASEYYQAHVFKEQYLEGEPIIGELHMARRVRIAITFYSANWQKIIEEYWKPLGNWCLQTCSIPFEMKTDTLNCRISLNGEDQKKGKHWAISPVGACSIKKVHIGKFSSNKATRELLKREVEMQRYPLAFEYEVTQAPSPSGNSGSNLFSIDKPKLELCEVTPCPFEFPITVINWETCLSPGQHPRTPSSSKEQFPLQNGIHMSEGNISVSSPPNQPQCYNSSLSFHCEGPSLKTIPEFFDSFKDEFMKVMAAKDIASKFKDGKILPPAKATAIAGMHDISEARSCLYHHVHEQADYEVARSLCEIMAKEEGYRNMNTLGEKMLKCIDQNAGRLKQ